MKEFLIIFPIWFIAFVILMVVSRGKKEKVVETPWKIDIPWEMDPSSPTYMIWCRDEDE